MTEQLRTERPVISAGVGDWLISCHAPDTVFNTPLDQQRYEHKQMIINMGGLPCRGEGIPDRFCNSCLFSKTG